MKIKSLLTIAFVMITFCLTAQSEGEEMLGDTLLMIQEDSLNTQSPESIEAENNGLAYIEDSPIVRMLDSLLRIQYFSDSMLWYDTVNLNKYGFSPLDVPNYPDSIYAARIAELDRESPLDLIYNRHVKAFIELYGMRKRGLTGRALGLSYVYFPMIEEQLDKYNIPLEMKYLAIVESALNPTAGSPVGAKGLWQFMYGTGKVYNLKVTSLVDDRFDPFKATEAACKHMNDLYNMYQDWYLVLAAYNSGAGTVNRAIRRAGGVKDYWAIWPFLPKETRGYVPAFIAVNYVMNYASEHNIYPISPGIIANGTDTVTVTEVVSFDQLNEMLGIPMRDLKFFNPQYKRDIIPATCEKPYILRIPTNFVGDFINNESELYAYKTKKGVEKYKLLEEVEKVSDQSVHVVRKGENLGAIAKKYSVSVNQLKSWNNLKSTNLRIGQKLTLFNSGAPMAQITKSPQKRSTSPTHHTVKSGETLGIIADKYKCNVTDLQEWNGLRSTKLQVGQQLKVYPPSEEKAQKGEVNGKYIYHTVKAGDTLWDIARAYDGVTVDQIKRLNKLSKNSKLQIGQKLKVASAG
ncbi:MAG: LysM peptidoglycan-binding domain-containing protein [Bacteroidales bacterium]|nr:LysM peptidoglycan-binding domain-containing protein [Bacteroidales bacterium]